MATTVSRRMIFVKGTKKKRVPLPKKPERPEGEELVGERAQSYTFSGAPRRRVQESAWVKYGKPAGILAGFAAVAGLLALLANMQSQPSYTESAPVSRSAVPRSIAYPRSPEVGAITISERPGVTDESFRASAYVRQKPSLPVGGTATVSDASRSGPAQGGGVDGPHRKIENISGDCTVGGSGGGGLDCLRRAVQ